jgi:hypothetical protein
MNSETGHQFRHCRATVQAVKRSLGLKTTAAKSSALFAFNRGLAPPLLGTVCDPLVHGKGGAGHNRPWPLHRERNSLRTLRSGWVTSSKNAGTSFSVRSASSLNVSYIRCGESDLAANLRSQAALGARHLGRSRQNLPGGRNPSGAVPELCEGESGRLV